MDKRGFLLILAAAVLWGTTGTAQALAPQGAQPLAIGALRLLVAGAALLVVFALGPGRTRLRSYLRQLFPPRAAGPEHGLPCPPRAAGPEHGLPCPPRAAGPEHGLPCPPRAAGPKHGLPCPPRAAGPLLLAAVCMAAYQVLFFAGVRLTGVAIGTVVGIGSSPVLAGLLGYLFRGERPGWRWGLATLLAVAGCGLLAAAGKDVHIDLLGMFLAIGAGAAYAIFSLLSKRLLERFPVELVMAAVFGLGAVLLAPLLLTQDLSWLANPRGVAAILHLGLLATALAYTLFGRGLRLVPLATAVTLSLAEPLTAGALGVLLLGEKLSLQAGLGILLIFGGLVVLALPRRTT